MEKFKPHYSLAVMQAQVRIEGIRAFTVSALNGGRAMGLSDEDLLSTIAGLTRQDFYKSMTTYHDPRIWQDVYHGNCPNGLLAYIKLTQVAQRIVIQFKEK